MAPAGAKAPPLLKAAGDCNIIVSVFISAWDPRLKQVHSQLNHRDTMPANAALVKSSGTPWWRPGLNPSLVPKSQLSKQQIEVVVIPYLLEKHTPIFESSRVITTTL